MNPILLRSLQIEYETSPLTIEQLSERHHVDLSSIEGTEAWKKAPKPLVIDIVPSLSDIPDTSDIPTKDESEIMKDNIHTTAKSLLASITTAMLDNDLEPKDIKLLGDTLMSIKDTVLGRDPTMVVNMNTSVNMIGQLKQMIISRPADC